LILERGAEIAFRIASPLPKRSSGLPRAFIQYPERCGLRQVSVQSPDVVDFIAAFEIVLCPQAHRQSGMTDGSVPWLRFQLLQHLRSPAQACLDRRQRRRAAQFQPM